MNESNYLSFIPMETRMEIIRKNWLSHDARWQYTVLLEFGIEKSNQLNQDIIQEVGKIMMFRLINALDVSQVTDLDEFQRVWSTAMNLYWPPPGFVYTFKREASIFRVSVSRCMISENVIKAGIAQYYECGCSAMRTGWFEALGVEADQKVEKCLKNGDNTCEIYWKVKAFSKMGESLEFFA
ncbi:MAG: hypothetical protein ACFFBD_16560 [Candidatus Hodarchaeota archaeon]